MCWGISCEKGWEPLLREMSEKLEILIEEWIKENPNLPDHPCASQVKEKFGTLRVYMTHSTNEIDDVIEEAERRSAVTCEACGEPGEEKNTGWIFTYCNKHYELAKKGWKIYQDEEEFISNHKDCYSSNSNNTDDDNDSMDEFNKYTEIK